MTDELPPLPEPLTLSRGDVDGVLQLGYTADQMRAYAAAAAAVAKERERCAHICNGIAAGYAGTARRLEGAYATRAAGQRDAANECAAIIRATQATPQPPAAS